MFDLAYRKPACPCWSIGQWLVWYEWRWVSRESRRRQTVGI